MIIVFAYIEKHETRDGGFATKVCLKREAYSGPNLWESSVLHVSAQELVGLENPLAPMHRWLNNQIALAVFLFGLAPLPADQGGGVGYFTVNEVIDVASEVVSGGTKLALPESSQVMDDRQERQRSLGPRRQ